MVIVCHTRPDIEGVTMFAQQIADAATRAHTLTRLDRLSRPIWRAPGLPAGVLHLCRHGSCPAVISRELGEVGLEIGERD
jgi:hypothetical protein